jgi:threonine/homoserine/homoserine lactone efflux protein
MLGQSLMLGTTQILISITINTIVVLSAGSIAVFLAARPGWITAQRWLMATVLGGLAVRIATDARR